MWKPISDGKVQNKCTGKQKKADDSPELPLLLVQSRTEFATCGPE